MVESRTRAIINLSNRITTEVHTASFRAVRGGMTTVPDALLLCISSSYTRRGALWDAYRRHYGQDGDRILVWQADTRSMNPSVDEQVIAEAYAQDESAAAAEYGAQFRLLLLALPELVQLMIETAVSTGMRISEILGLKWGCVDLDRGLVWVRERYYQGDTDEPKSERSRRVLPLGYLVEAYRRRRARCPTLSGYVFEKTANQWMTEHFSKMRFVRLPSSWGFIFRGSDGGRSLGAEKSGSAPVAETTTGRKSKLGGELMGDLRELCGMPRGPKWLSCWKDGRPERARTADLYRVKVAL